MLATLLCCAMTLFFALRKGCFLVAWGASAACAGSGPRAGSPAGSDACNDVDLEVEKVWSASIKAQVLGYQGGGSLEERQKIANKMDAISEDWVRLRRSVCLDHLKRKVISAEEYRAQVKCFDDRLDQQRKLVTLLKSEVTDETRKLAHSLTEAPSACK